VLSIQAILVLAVVFLVTGAIGVVTGSNSLITVPLMFQFGVEPRVAVATNMFALVFMALGGTIPFLRNGDIPRSAVVPLAFLTFVSSALGALIVSFVGDASIKIIVSAAMISVALFVILVGEPTDPDNGRFGSLRLPLTYVLAFALGIYGGLFSGGYVTILTAVLVGIYGMQYSEAIASTKLINFISSGIATAVFMWKGLVDYKLGLILGTVMFAGGYLGAVVVTKLSNVWLKHIFHAAVLLLAAKTIYDLIVIEFGL
jgi:uncharacterized membrane protein YfcA